MSEYKELGPQNPETHLLLLASTLHTTRKSRTLPVGSDSGWRERVESGVARLSNLSPPTLHSSWETITMTSPVVQTVPTCRTSRLVYF